MNVDEKILYWFELAEDDLDTAEIVLINKRYLHFGFLCHLIVERLLKAYFWKSQKTEPPYTHNLLILASKSELSEILDKKNKELLYNLMPLNIQARYPSSKDEIYKKLTKDYCYELMSQTKEFYKWMTALLKN